ncbi:MAG: WD40 repeat domain-containing protein [Chitinophagaceae bacterium]
MKCVLIVVCSFIVTISYSQAPRLIYPVGNSNDVTEANISPDGRFIVTKKKTRTQVWSREAGKLIYSFDRDGGAGAEFSADSKTLISLMDGYVTTTDLKTGNRKKVILRQFKNGSKARFSKDDKFIITGNERRDSIIIWTNPAGKLVQSFKGNIDKIVFTGNKYAATVVSDTCLQWDIKKNILIRTIPLMKYTKNSLSPDGKIVAAVKEKKIQLWDINSGTKLKDLDPGEQGKEMQGFSFSEDGRRLLSYSADSVAILWDLGSSSILKKVKYTPGFPSASCWLSPDGQKIIVNAREKLVFYDVSSGKAYDSLIHKDFLFDKLYFTSGLKYIYAFSRLGMAVYTGPDYKKYFFTTQADGIKMAQLSPGNKYLLTSTEDIAKLWDIRTGKFLASMYMGRNDFTCTFNDDASRLLMQDGRDLDVWSIPDGRRVYSIRNERRGYILKAFISGDGNRVGLVSGSDISIWDSIGKKPLLKISDIPNLRNQSPIFNYDGSRLLAASRDSFFIYNSTNGSLIKRFGKTSSDSTFEYVFISRDDKYVLTHDAKHSNATLWDIPAGRKLYNLKDSLSQFSKDGKYIIAGKVVYDVATGKQVEPLENASMAYPLARTAADQYTLLIPEEEPRETKMVQVIENKTGYSYFLMPLEKNNSLVFDSNDHYDGTTDARPLLYLTCGDAVIKGDEVKTFWVPGLVERILKGEKITAKTPADLPVCK